MIIVGADGVERVWPEVSSGRDAKERQRMSLESEGSSSSTSSESACGAWTDISTEGNDLTTAASAEGDTYASSPGQGHDPHSSCSPPRCRSPPPSGSPQEEPREFCGPGTDPRVSLANTKHDSLECPEQLSGHSSSGADCRCSLIGWDGLSKEERAGKARPSCPALRKIQTPNLYLENRPPTPARVQFSERVQVSARASGPKWPCCESCKKRKMSSTDKDGFSWWGAISSGSGWVVETSAPKAQEAWGWLQQATRDLVMHVEAASQPNGNKPAAQHRKTSGRRNKLQIVLGQSNT